ncbi:MAG: hypothetical protein EOP04_01270 [Proteobacteria bacterium]|nr:MAG: hypothetical protein EOP04_01270 [Pseudomonadota bacterium]
MSNIIDMNSIELRGTNFHVGAFIIPLHGRKRMYALIKFLLENPEGAKRDRIRCAIYPDSSKELSFRLRDSQDCSLSKLISRSRRYLKQALADHDVGKHIRWLMYCGDERCWRLSDLTIKTNEVAPEDVPRKLSKPSSKKLEQLGKEAP